MNQRLNRHAKMACELAKRRWSEKVNRTGKRRGKVLAGDQDLSCTAIAFALKTGQLSRMIPNYGGRWRRRGKVEKKRVGNFVRNCKAHSAVETPPTIASVHKLRLKVRRLFLRTPNIHDESVFTKIKRSSDE
jgi:hypothetical protein